MTGVKCRHKQRSDCSDDRRLDTSQGTIVRLARARELHQAIRGWFEDEARVQVIFPVARPKPSHTKAGLA